jgi:hypothetical protein
MYEKSRPSQPFSFPQLPWWWPSLTKEIVGMAACHN